MTEKITITSTVRDPATGELREISTSIAIPTVLELAVALARGSLTPEDLIVECFDEHGELVDLIDPYEPER